MQFISAYFAIMELAQIRTFLAVAQAGGFAAAAKTLDVTPSTVTRSVAKLETSLGIRLLQRTTRSVMLTEQGEAFLSRVSPALEEIETAADMVRRESHDLSGILRVSASVSFGQIVIAPNLSRFCTQYPNLEVELVLSDDRTDLIAERIDITVRHGTLEDSSLIAQRLASVRYRLVASPDYLRSANTITHPKNLTEHPCLTFPYPAFRSRWQFTSGHKRHEVDISSTLRVSNAAALASCAKSGMGLALLADWMIDADIAAGSVVNVLPDWSASGHGMEAESALWSITPSRSFVPAKTRAFNEFLRAITNPKGVVSRK